MRTQIVDWLRSRRYAVAGIVKPSVERTQLDVADPPVRSNQAWIDARLIAAIEAIWEDPSGPLSVAGVSGMGIPDSWREPPADVGIPLMERLRALEERLRSHLDLFARQMSEFDNPEDEARLRAEALSCLISLRELHSFVSELDRPPNEVAVGFRKLKPQWVRHNTGYEVAVLDRETIAYSDQTTRATVIVDIGATVIVYGHSVRYEVSDATSATPEIVATRVAEGLRAMGSKAKVEWS